jgi:hypothetical protein
MGVDDGQQRVERDEKIVARVKKPREERKSDDVVAPAARGVATDDDPYADVPCTD